MNNKNLPFYIGMIIPVVLIIAVAILAYLPYLNAEPMYDFVYVVDEQRYNRNTPECTLYQVTDGSFSIVAKDVKQYPHDLCLSSAPTFYRHDVSENESRAISFEMLEKLELDSTGISPDGYQFVQDRSYVGLFGGRSEYKWYLQKKSVRLKQYVAFGDYYRSGSHFVGWIIEE